MRAYLVPVLLILAVVFIAGCTSVKGKICGDFKCESGETLTNCPTDCSVCGDSKCTGNEAMSSCEIDCKVCGDGMCTATENQANCKPDCENSGVNCPNGACEGSESEKVRAGNIETYRCYKDCVVVPAGTA